MRVDQAFKKCGFEIVDVKRGDSSMLIDVRIPLTSIVPQRWKQFLEHVLTVEEEVSMKPSPKWTGEIAKRFFSRNSSLRYLWRVRVSGDLVAASHVLVTAALNALRTGNELTSVPLVGAQMAPPDPANGRYKGAYPRGEDDRASSVVANAFAVGR